MLFRSCLGTKDIRDKNNVLGVEDLPVLVVGATDGASVNIGQHNGVIGKLIAEQVIQILPLDHQ